MRWRMIDACIFLLVVTSTFLFYAYGTIFTSKIEEAQEIFREQPRPEIFQNLLTSAPEDAAIENLLLATPTEEILRQSVNSSDNAQTIHIVLMVADNQNPKTPSVSVCERVETLLKSILVFYSGQLHVHFLTNTRSGAVLTTLFRTWPLARVRTSFYNIEEDQRSLEWVKSTHKVSGYGQLKYIIPDILPEYVDSAIFIDTDMLVLEDISVLYSYFTEMNEKGIMFAMTTDQYTRRDLDQMFGKGASRKSVNSGLVLYNMRAMRAGNWNALWRETGAMLMRTLGNLNCPQDLFAAVAILRPDVYLKLPCVYNFQIGKGAMKWGCIKSTNDLWRAKIPHWTGPMKYYEPTGHSGAMSPLYRCMQKMDGYEFEESSGVQKYRTITHLRNTVRTGNHGDVTLAAHAYYKDSIQLIERLNATWFGPISLGICGSSWERAQLVAFLFANPLHDMFDVHFVHHRGAKCPVDYMWKSVIDASWTSSVLMVESIVSIKADEDLRKKCMKKSKMALKTFVIRKKNDYNDKSTFAGTLLEKPNAQRIAAGKFGLEEGIQELNVPIDIIPVHSAKPTNSLSSAVEWRIEEPTDSFCRREIARRRSVVSTEIMNICSMLGEHPRIAIRSFLRLRMRLILLCVISLLLLGLFLRRKLQPKCTYIDFDLVFVPPGVWCDAMPKMPSKYHESRRFGSDNVYVAPTESDLLPDEFDYSQCPPFSTMKVFVPRADHHPLAKALAQHPAATFVQSEACIDIEFADSDQSIAYSPKRNGSNLLVINLDSSSTVTAMGSVMLAQDNYAPGAFRTDLDMAVHTDVPAFDIDGWKTESSLLPVQRKFNVALISAPGDPKRLINSNGVAFKTVVCTGKQCDFDLSLVSFCVIWPSSAFQAHLLHALQGGCIPVIMSHTQPLPFQDHLDWELAAFRFPHSSINQALRQLETLRNEDFLEMRRRGIVFRRRLDNADALARSLLAAAATKLQLQLPAAPMSSTKHLFATSYESPNTTDGDALASPTKKPYARIASSPSHKQLNRMYSNNRWNSGRDLTFTPRTLHDVYELPSETEYYSNSNIIRTTGSQNGGAFARGLGLNREPEQFTVVVMTYNRDEGVKDLIFQLNNCPHLNKVIIVWNNVGRIPEPSWPKIHVPVEFIASARNSVSNRFLPMDRIETEAVLTIDDDMNVGRHEIVYGFKVWRQNRDRIVGYFDRYHSRWGETSKYGKDMSCEYSMMIGAFFFVHKEFFYEYSYNMHPAIRKMVDDTRNCDDIAINYLVSHLTRKAPLKVEKTEPAWNTKGFSRMGISSSRDHHMERNECMLKLNAIYGYNPLMLSQVKAMPSIDTCVQGM